MLQWNTCQFYAAKKVKKTYSCHFAFISIFNTLWSDISKYMYILINITSIVYTHICTLWLSHVAVASSKPLTKKVDLGGFAEVPQELIFTAFRYLDIQTKFQVGFPQENFEGICMSFQSHFKSALKNSWTVYDCFGDLWKHFFCWCFRGPPMCQQILITSKMGPRLSSTCLGFISSTGRNLLLAFGWGKPRLMR